MLCIRSGFMALAATALGLAVGCGGHSGGSLKGSVAGGSTAAVNTNTTTGTATGDDLEISGSALAANQARFVPDAVVALAFSVEATGAQKRVLRFDITSSGTVDESLLGAVAVVEDTNGNGVVDAGETALASAPSAQNDDDSYVVMPVTPLVFAAGTPRSFLITMDGTQVSPADQAASVGKTIQLEVDIADVVAQNDAGQPANVVNSSPPGGGSTPPPIGSTVTLEVNDTVLISEVCPGPGSGATSAEFVELFNATAAVVDVSNYYITDFTDNPTSGRFHWKLPTGNDFQGSTADWIVRFPPNTSLQPGEVITVAVDGVGFKAAHGSDPSFCMRNKGTTTATQMFTWDGVAGGVNFVQQDISGSGSLTGPGSSNFATGELVCLFSWDGTSDLIQDVDLINYGDASATNTAVDKSPNQQATNPGAPDVKVDSAFDSDTTESTFQNDSDELFQYNHRAPNGTSLRRVDFTEGQEVKTGGNGITGNDETSEDFGDGIGGDGTFKRELTATPGQL